jgi:hypothetical protein
LKDLSEKEPNKRVGLVCFNSEVLVIGDGSQPQKTIAGDHLNSYDYLSKLQLQQTHLKEPISKVVGAL